MAYKHSSVAWYDDGNIVIECEGTVFRVYRGVLARDAPVLAALLPAPDPNRAQVFYGGVPLVHLADRADDMGHFLQAMHDPRYYDLSRMGSPAIWDYTRRGTLGYPLFVGILRLSTKYKVEYLRARAIEHITARYPPSLSQWDKLEEDFGPEYLMNPYAEDLNPFEVANLAREYDITSILPIVLYECSTGSPSSIPGGMPYRENQDGPKVFLSAKNLEAVLVGRITLMGRHFSDIWSWVWHTNYRPDDCLNKERCAHVRDNAMEDASNCLRHPIYIPLLLSMESDNQFNNDIQELCDLAVWLRRGVETVLVKMYGRCSQRYSGVEEVSFPTAQPTCGCGGVPHPFEDHIDATLDNLSLVD